MIEFAAPSSLYREEHRASQLPILGNGPPGTFVLMPGLRVSLPTDQIIFANDSGGCARVGFGGMQFVGVQDEQLVFERIRELWSDDRLSPDRSRRMRLNPEWVTEVSEGDQRVWPLP